MSMRSTAIILSGTRETTFSSVLRLLIAAFLILGSFALNARSASAQTACGERAKFLSNLAKTHKEAPTSIGVTSAGQVVEVLTSAGGSWTIIVTAANGRTCVVAAGEAWESITRAALGPSA